MFKHIISFLYVAIMMGTLPLMAQENPLELILKRTEFKSIMERPFTYRIQILYTQINRDARNKAQLQTFTHRLDSNEYFYPASTVKLAASVLALEKLNKLGIDKSTTMHTFKNRPSQVEVTADSSAKNGQPSIEQYIKKILLVSDNEAYNRLYEFIGQKELNEKMAEKGFKGVRLTHRLQVPLSPLENQYGNPIAFLNSKGNQIFRQEESFNSTQFQAQKPIFLGKGVMNSKGEIESHPLEFTFKNAYPLEAQHEFLKRLMFPEAFSKNKRFDLKQKDYEFLYQYMSQYPTEAQYPNYNRDTTYFPAYCKFLYYGSNKNAVINPNIRIFNKVGDAYGFLLDNAYVVDFKNKIEFMVTAVILCNEDEIFNDDHYEYEKIGFPFFEKLGKAIYEHELTRKRDFKPKLDYLKFKYEK